MIFMRLKSKKKKRMKELNKRKRGWLDLKGRHTDSNVTFL